MTTYKICSKKELQNDFELGVLEQGNLQNYKTFNKYQLINYIKNGDDFITVSNDLKIKKTSPYISNVSWKVVDDCIFMFDFYTVEEIVQKNFLLLNSKKLSNNNIVQLTEEQKTKEWFDYYTNKTLSFPEFYANEISNELEDMQKVSFVKNLIAIYEIFLNKLLKETKVLSISKVKEINKDLIVNYHNELEIIITNANNKKSIKDFQSLCIKLRKYVNKAKHEDYDLSYSDIKNVLKNHENYKGGNELEFLKNYFIVNLDMWKYTCRI